MINFSSQTFKRYFANTSWIMVERIIRMFVTLFTGIYVARYLGPESFGLLSYALSFVGLFSILSTLGLDEIVVRNLVQNIGRREKILGTAFLLKLFGFIIMLLAVYIAARLTSDDNYTNTLILIIAFGILFQSFNVIDVYFESQVLAKFSSCAKFLSLTGASMLKMWFIYIQAPLLWFAWAFVLENAFLAICLVFFYKSKNLAIHRWQFEGQRAFSYLRNSWPLILSGLAVMLYMRIDQIMIKLFMSNEAVGHYAVAVKLSEAWYFIPTAICTSLFPAILEAKQINQQLYYDRLQKLYDLMFWIAICIALPISFFAKDLLTLFFGSQYIKATVVLKIYIWSGLFVYLGVASAKYLIAENLLWLSFVRTWAGCVINITLNLVLIPSHGIKGAAWSTVISYAIANVSMALSPKARESIYMMSYSFLPFWKRKVKY